MNQSNNSISQEIHSPWLTVTEAAEYLKVYSNDGTPNRGYIYKLVSSGLLTPYKLGRFNRFKLSDLDSLLQKRKP